MLVLDGKHEELAKMYAASLYGGQPLESSASMEQSDLGVGKNFSKFDSKLDPFRHFLFLEISIEI